MKMKKHEKIQMALTAFILIVGVVVVVVACYIVRAIANFIH